MTDSLREELEQVIIEKPDADLIEIWNSYADFFKDTSMFFVFIPEY